MHLEIRTTAAQAIVEQADYYQLQSGSALAMQWETAVDEAIQRLLRWPEAGALARFRSPRLAGMRWVAVRGFARHLIFYRYFHETDTLDLIHVMHGARDLEALLDPEM